MEEAALTQPLQPGQPRHPLHQHPSAIGSQLGFPALYQIKYRYKRQGLKFFCKSVFWTIIANSIPDNPAVIERYTGMNSIPPRWKPYSLYNQIYIYTNT